MYQKKFMDEATALSRVCLETGQGSPCDHEEADEVLQVWQQLSSKINY